VPLSTPPVLLARSLTCTISPLLHHPETDAKGSGATAKNNTYLFMGGPLLAGVTVVALSSIAPMALPLGMRGLAIAEALSLYGGLAVFSGFVLYDTQKILANARAAAAGRIPADPLRESVSLQLDSINLFSRLVQILALQQGRRK
jgi:FtsH-binding integral membrane protein